MTKELKGAKPLQTPPQLTQEQQAAMVARGFTQKFNSIAEALLFNIVHGAAQNGQLPAPEEIVDQVISITEIYAERINDACDEAFERIFNKKENKVEEPKQEAQG